MSIKPPQYYLESDNSTLNEISQKLMRLQHINALLAELLPPNLVGHCQATELDRGTLTLTASDSSFGMLLRYQMQTILSGLRQHPTFAGLATIKTKVRPLEILPAEIKKEPPPKKMTMHLSQQAGATLLECAENIADKDIRDALVNLAKRAQTKDIK